VQRVHYFDSILAERGCLMQERNWLLLCQTAMQWLDEEAMQGQLLQQPLLDEQLSTATTISRPYNPETFTMPHVPHKYMVRAIAVVVILPG
jgi:hypothetical protein